MEPSTDDIIKIKASASRNIYQVEESKGGVLIGKSVNLRPGLVSVVKQSVERGLSQCRWFL